MNKMAGAGFASSLVGPWFGGKAHRRSLHFATPEFLSRLVALANFMQLSLMKAAHVDLSDMAKQEFGYATVGMTNLLGGRDGKFAWGTGWQICLGDGMKASALPVQSILDLPTGKSAPSDDKGEGRASLGMGEFTPLPGFFLRCNLAKSAH